MEAMDFKPGRGWRFNIWRFDWRIVNSEMAIYTIVLVSLSEFLTLFQLGFVLLMVK